MAKSRLQGLSILLVTTLVWGSTFPLLKISLADISPGFLISTRFVLASVVLLPFAARLNKALIRDGMILGSVFFYLWQRKTLALRALPLIVPAF
jgi:drug/metabolite transporter (DMT)-like permease